MSESPRAPRIALFDPHSGGHHGLYVDHLVRHWAERRLSGSLELLVPDDFLELHADLAQRIRGLPAGTIVTHRLGARPLPSATGRLALARRDLAAGRRLAGWLRAHRPDHCLAMYADHLFLSLAVGLRFDFPLRISGIYFRPSFHYGRLVGTSRLLQRARLAAAARNRHMAYLFCLDPDVVPLLAERLRRVQPVFLPEGVPRVVPHGQAAERGSAVELREALGIEPERRLVTLVGSLARRKGIGQLLEAARRLEPRTQRALALLLAGRIADRERDAIEPAIGRAREETAVRIVLEDRFLGDDELARRVAAADLMLLTYPRHIGSSTLLAVAATAGVPVLGTGYGLVGEQIRRWGLGKTVDATDPDAIARALEHFVAAPRDTGFHPARARRFAEESTGERFAQVILERLHPEG